ncbi:hypothetical protein Q5H93_00355 [Hymenobacter sp. ASUV-10]|uniref:Signal transduction histidine kinase subgroup 3 dimerisation and phosphoacceptor domain-containing protein n=1 Tax=Hymenobacter aranciens TaxID=3063996 RepID=A0ABT9B4I7_9BACT|nr:histidine kinase [Hymenobacter sp. ASUV-10]MDO7873166.1 hypothetical protein [Hymenobacter sp. ASUV-10]
MIYRNTHRLPLARQHALVSLQMARKLGDPDREALALQTLAEIMHAQGQVAAFDTLTRYLAIHDTILSHERVEAVVAAQARYDLAGEKARRQLAQQRGELDRLRYRQYLAGGAGLGLLALVLTGAGVWRYRRQREQALRAELAAELHDELGSMLTRVTLRAELLEARHSSPQLLALVQESRTAAATVRDIIWSVDTTADTVEALLDRLRATVEVIRRDTEQELQLQLALPDSLLAARLRATVRQQVYLIGREGLTNALRHGRRHGLLAISLQLDAKELLLRIENETRTEVAGPNGQGLRSMQTRAAAVGGTLQAGPQPEGRWQVLLRVPKPLA